MKGAKLPCTALRQAKIAALWFRGIIRSYPAHLALSYALTPIVNAKWTSGARSFALCAIYSDPIDVFTGGLR